jgi:hypothetical protein
LDKFADGLKSFTRETLSEAIGTLFLGVNLEDSHNALFDSVPEMVPLDQKTFGPVGKTVLGAEKKGSSVVFKDAAAHS